MLRCCWRKKRHACVTPMDRVNAPATETTIPVGAIGAHGVRAQPNAVVANNSERDHAKKRNPIAMAPAKWHEHVIRIHAEVSSQ